MRVRSARLGAFFQGSVVTTGLVLACVGGCNGGGAGDDVAGAAGIKNESGGAHAAGGASQGGEHSGAGAPGDAGAGGVGDTGGGGSSSGGASAASGGASSSMGGAEPGADCYVELSENTSNAADADTPLNDSCRATTFEGQINFEAVEGSLAYGRDLNIDFFDAAVEGATVDLANDPNYEHAAASYVDSAGVWNADAGTVTIVSVQGDTYVVELKDVHFSVISGQPFEPTATGAFVANGTITADAMPSQ